MRNKLRICVPECSFITCLLLFPLCYRTRLMRPLYEITRANSQQIHPVLCEDTRNRRDAQQLTAPRRVCFQMYSPLLFYIHPLSSHSHTLRVASWTIIVSEDMAQEISVVLETGLYWLSGHHRSAHAAQRWTGYSSSLSFVHSSVFCVLLSFYSSSSEFPPGVYYTYACFCGSFYVAVINLKCY